MQWIGQWASAQNRQDWLELRLVPGLAAVLPWPVAFRIFRWLCFHTAFLYADKVNPAWAQAQQRGQVSPGQEAVWKAERRLVTLVDHADMYLSRRHGERFGQRYMTVQGQWPEPGQAAVLVTFHWGAGMWGLYHARCHGLHVSALMESLRPEFFEGRPVLYRYIKARVGQIEKALQRKPIDISKSLKPVFKALNEGEQILSVADVPADRAATWVQVRFGGAPARVPKALFKTLASQRVPVAYYITGINLLDGSRFLRIRNLGVYDDADALAERLFGELDSLIQEKLSLIHI